jgi:hypothetical protein
MKQYLTFVWSMAALAFFPVPVLGAPQNNLRGGNKEHSAKTGVLGVLERLPRGSSSDVQGMLGELGIDPKKASKE